MERTFFQWVSLIIDKYGEWFIKGAVTTMQIALVGTIIGLCIGLIVGTIKTIPINRKQPLWQRTLLRMVNFVLSCYIEIFRGTPMIVQATLLYFGMLEAFNIDIASFTAALMVVSINTGAYMAEIVRGGIDSVDKGQYEAAHALGMSHWQTMLKVVLPQAVRNILPAVGNEFVVNIKDTAVLNVISVTELYFMTKSVKGVLTRTYEPFFVAAVIYFVLTFTTTRILRYIERKMDGPDSYSIHGAGSGASRGVTGITSTIKVKK